MPVRPARAVRVDSYSLQFSQREAAAVDQPSRFAHGIGHPVDGDRIATVQADRAGGILQRGHPYQLHIAHLLQVFGAQPGREAHAVGTGGVRQTDMAGGRHQTLSKATHQRTEASTLTRAVVSPEALARVAAPTSVLLVAGTVRRRLVLSQ